MKAENKNWTRCSAFWNCLSNCRLYGSAYSLGLVLCLCLWFQLWAASTVTYSGSGLPLYMLSALMMSNLSLSSHDQISEKVLAHFRTLDLYASRSLEQERRWKKKRNKKRGRVKTRKEAGWGRHNHQEKSVKLYSLWTIVLEDWPFQLWEKMRYWAVSKPYLQGIRSPVLLVIKHIRHHCIFMLLTAHGCLQIISSTAD